MPGREVEGEEGEGGGKVYMVDGRRVEVREGEPDWEVFLPSLARVEDDLVMIDDMNEGLIIHNIRERFKQDKIYTSIGYFLFFIFYF